MKRTSIFLCIFSIIFGNTFAQLDAIKAQIDNKGIFGRLSKLQVVDPVYPQTQPNHRSSLQERNKQNLRDTLTFDFLRIYGLHPEIIEEKQVYIGKAFLSNRHLFGYANKKYAFTDSLRQDQEGTFMMCKLYVSNKKAYLNLYPLYVLNICNKTIHKGLKCKNLTDHYHQLAALVCQADMEYKDYSDRNNTIFGKYIKCFQIEIVNGNVNGLELAYTKNSYSDDRIESVKYRFDFCNNDSLSLLDGYAFILGFLKPYLATNAVINPVEKQSPEAFLVELAQIDFDNKRNNLDSIGNNRIRILNPSLIRISSPTITLRSRSSVAIKPKPSTDILTLTNSTQNNKWFFAGSIIYNIDGGLTFKDATVENLPDLLSSIPPTKVQLSQDILVREYCPAPLKLGYQLSRAIEALPKGEHIKIEEIRQIEYENGKAVWLKIQ